jgi:hypothetical protein
MDQPEEGAPAEFLILGAELAEDLVGAAFEGPLAWISTDHH